MPVAVGPDRRERAAHRRQHVASGLVQVLVAQTRRLAVPAPACNLAGQADVHVQRHSKLAAAAPVSWQDVVDSCEALERQHVAPIANDGLPKPLRTMTEKGRMVTPENRGEPTYPATVDAG